MANQVNITITAKDEASKALANATSNIQQLAGAAGSANPRVQELASKLAVARQRLDEASASGKAKASTLMSLQRQVNTYQNQLSQATDKETAMNAVSGSLSRNMGALAGTTVLAAVSVASLGNFIGSSVASANNLQSALLGLTSVARAFGVDSESAKQAAQSLAADGLMTVGDAATSLKNLLASNFSLDQSIQIMNRFKDSAAFGRQAALGFGESIRGATEGIKNGNSILVDNAGVTKNLSVMLEEAGYSAQDVMRATSDAGVRQALFNGIMRETTAQVGDASRLTQTYAGEQVRAAASVETMKQSIGGVVQMMSGGLLQAFTNVIGNNQQMIISFGGATVAAGIFAGGLFLAIRAIQAFSIASFVAAATNPLILALTAIGALAGVVVYKAMDKLQQKVAEYNKQLGNMGDTLGNTMPAQTGAATKAMKDLGNRLADIDKQIAKANRDFQENLAEMIKGHQDKVNSLSTQLNEENADFKKAMDRRTADFKSAQDDMTEEHDKKAGDLQKQIDDELALGRWADTQKVRGLQDQLAQENKEYDKQLADKQLKYDQDVNDAQQAHTKKTTDLQAQLDTENALLTKHAADVASIRNVTMLDEIDKLKRSHDEQIAAFEDQKNKAIQSSGEAANGVVSNWNGAAASLANNDNFKNVGSQMGKEMGDAFMQALKETLVTTALTVGRFLESFGRMMNPTTLYELVKNKGDVLKTFQEYWDKSSIGGDQIRFGARAAGGPVSYGRPYLVGENGPELMVPSQSGTIIPAGQTAQVLSGAGGRGVSIGNLIVNGGGDPQSIAKLVVRQIGFKLA